MSEAKIIFSEEHKRHGDGCTIVKKVHVAQEPSVISNGEQEVLVTRCEVSVSRSGGSREITMSQSWCFVTDLQDHYAPTDANRARDEMADVASELKRRIKLAIEG